MSLNRADKKSLSLADADEICDMYESTIEIAKHSGLLQYEVSNFAAPGAESIHNMAYWRGLDYIGIGPGAHGRYFTSASGLESVATVETPSPNDWMAEIEATGSGIRKSARVPLNQRLKETLTLGLRSREGVDAALWHALSGSSLRHLYDHLTRSKPHLNAFFLHTGSPRLSLTDHGVRLADSIASEVCSALDSLDKSK